MKNESKAMELVKDYVVPALEFASIVGGFALDHFDVLESWFKSAYPVIQPLLFTLLGILLGQSLARTACKKQLADRDAEIDRLNSLKRERSGRFKEFSAFNHDDQRQIVSVMLSEPGGLAPTENQRKHMGEWVSMKDFLRYDPGSDRMHLVDGVKEMLLENPDHVYELMAARVDDLERQLAANPSDGRNANDADSSELDRLRIRNAALKSNALEKDGEISSLEKRVDNLESVKGAPDDPSDRSDDEMYALIGTAGLSDLLWAYDYINEKGPIPASPFGGKMESRRIQRLVNKGVLISIGGMLSDGSSYDMAKEWSLFVHHERAEIERRLDALNE